MKTTDSEINKRDPGQTWETAQETGKDEAEEDREEIKWEAPERWEERRRA